MSPISQEEFKQLQDVVMSTSPDSLKPQAALTFLKERELSHPKRRLQLSSTQLSYLLVLASSHESKKSLVLLLAPYVTPENATSMKAIVDQFPPPTDRAEIASILMKNMRGNDAQKGSGPSFFRKDLGLATTNHGSSPLVSGPPGSSNTSGSGSDIFPMPQPHPRKGQYQQQLSHLQQHQQISSGRGSAPVPTVAAMELSSNSEDSSSCSGSGDEGGDEGSSYNGIESRGGSTLNSQEDVDELGGPGGGREGGGCSPSYGASTASTAPSVLSFVTSGAGGGSSAGAGATASVVDSLVVVGSVATTLSSYDSTGSLSTIESSASTEVSQRRPFQHRSSFLKPVSGPPGGGGSNGDET